MPVVNACLLVASMRGTFVCRRSISLSAIYLSQLPAMGFVHCSAYYAGVLLHFVNCVGIVSRHRLCRPYQRLLRSDTIRTSAPALSGFVAMVSSPFFCCLRRIVSDIGSPSPSSCNSPAWLRVFFFLRPLPRHCMPVILFPYCIIRHICYFIHFSAYLVQKPRQNLQMSKKSRTFALQFEQ